MRPTTLLAALLVSSALLAGCTVSNQESTSPTSGNERSFTVDVPSGATQLRVDTTATTQAGTPDVTVLVKDEGASILGTHTWAVKDRATDTLSVNVNGQARLFVIAKVIDGDASLDVRVSAVVPGQPEVIVIQRTIVITQTVTTTTTPTTVTPTPPVPSTPASTPPTPTPTSAPTPTPSTPSPPPNTTANNTTPTPTNATP